MIKWLTRENIVSALIVAALTTVVSGLWWMNERVTAMDTLVNAAIEWGTAENGDILKRIGRLEDLHLTEHE